MISTFLIKMEEIGKEYAHVNSGKDGLDMTSARHMAVEGWILSFECRPPILHLISYMR
jgi:hypothetical protein